MDVSVNDKGVYAFGAFRLDPVRRTLSRDGAPIKLTPRLFDTLVYLVHAEGRLIDKDEMMAAVWGGRIVEEANLAQAISSLRRVLQNEGGDPGMIVTAPGRGYRFAAAVTLLSGAPDAMATSETSAFIPTASSGKYPPRGRFAVAAAFVLALIVVVPAIRHTVEGRHAPPLPMQTAPPQVGFAPPHSVAVLAFTTMSSDPDKTYLGDGLAEELINALARVPGVHVAARVSAFSFKGSQATIEDIARRLHVGMVLEGSVRFGADTLRVATELIDARTGYQVWSRTYDRAPTDLLSIEGEVARAVAASLEISLVQGEAARLTLGETSIPTAFDAYLRGMQLLRSNEDSAIVRGLAEFDRAVALDPNYARAFAGRAYALCDIGMNPVVGTTAAQTSKTFADALAAADKAIAIAPDLATGHAARGVIMDNGYVNFREAAAEAFRARELEPGNAAIVGTYAEVAADLGHSDDAIPAARLATSLDPLRADAWYLLGFTQYSARRYQDSLATTAHERELRGKPLPEHSMEIVARDELMLGRFTEAERSCHAVSDAYQDICLAIAAHALRDTKTAQTHLARLLSAGNDNAFSLALVYAQWGDAGQALTWLETALRVHDPVLSQIRSEPLLDPIRSEARFASVEHALNLPP